MHQKCTSPVSVVAHRFKNEVKKKKTVQVICYMKTTFESKLLTSMVPVGVFVNSNIF